MLRHLENVDQNLERQRVSPKATGARARFRSLGQRFAGAARSLGQRGSRPFRVGLLLVAAAILGIAILDVLIDEPVRRRIVERGNRNLVGYSFHVGKADLSPWNFSLDLFEVVVAQSSHPKPPVLQLENLEFSVAWRALLRAKLVADLEIDRPRVHVNLVQLREERDDDTRMRDRGWQQALRELYPLRVDRLALHDGSLTYVDEDPERPLVLTHVSGEALDIRNVTSEPGDFPSPFRFDGVVFETGRATVLGRGDFLAEPLPAGRASFRVANVPLEDLQPVTGDYHLHVSGGRLASTGDVLVTAKEKKVHIDELTVGGVRVDYVSDPELTQRAVEAIAEAKDSAVEVVIDELRLADAELGFIDRARDPDYRVFVSDLDLALDEWTNRANREASRFKASGDFMGSGATRLAGVFRPDRDGADFDLAVAIQDTRLASMNDLLRAWANVDVTDGLFSFYSELRVADGQLDGYIKPLFSDVDVFDPEQDREKGFFRKLWERLVDGIGNLLENRPRDEVVTVADLAGSVENPDASNMQVVLNLIRNAFFDAILPGFRDRVDNPRDRSDGKKERAKADEKRNEKG